MDWILIFVPLYYTFFLKNILQVNGDIRCFCNHPVCVRTGYMCKSEGPLAACYSEYDGVSEKSNVNSRHGCKELLPIHMQKKCDHQIKSLFSMMDKSIDVNGGNIANKGHHNHHRNKKHRGHHRSGSRNPLISCCPEDMCNYPSSLDMEIPMEDKVNQRAFYNGDALSESSSEYTEIWWFRVSVIVVPIAGSIALFILILLAAKVLRQDSKRQRQLQELKKQRDYKNNALYTNGFGKPKHNEASIESRCGSPLTPPTKVINQLIGFGKHNDPYSNSYNLNDNEKIVDKLINDDLNSDHFIYQKQLNSPPPYSSLLSWDNLTNV